MKSRLVLVIIALLVAPASASAAWDWWEFFDQLSGPGPFKSTVPNGIEFKLYSWNPTLVTTESKRHLTLSDDARIEWYPAVRVVRLNNDADLQMFQDQPNDMRHVRLTTIDLSIMRRQQWSHGNVDLGAGVAILRFSGDGFDPIYRVGVGPKVTATPLGFIRTKNATTRAWLRVTKFYGEGTLMEGFTGRNFGNTSTTFSTSAEFKWRFGFVFDLTTVAYGLGLR